MSHRIPKRAPTWPAGLVLLLAGALAPSLARGAAGPVMLGWEIQHYEFSTLTRDVGAMVVNPAGLASSIGADMHFDVTGDRGRLDEWVAGLQGGAWGVAYRHRDLVAVDGYPNGANVDSYVFGFGFGKPAFSIGASREVDKIDVPGEDATRWLFGFQSQPVSWLVLGGTVRDPQHPRFLDGTLTPSYTYGLSLVSNRGGARFGLSAEGSHRDGAPNRIDLAFGLEASFASGLRLEALLYDQARGPTEFGFSIGTRFDRGRAATRVRTVDADRGYRVQLAADFYDQRRRESGK